MKAALLQVVRALGGLRKAVGHAARGLEGPRPAPIARRRRSRSARRFWTPEEIRIVRRRFARETSASLAKDLGRSVAAVNGLAFNLGLNKDPDFVLETNRRLGRALGQHPNSVAARFQPGRAGGCPTEKHKQAFLEGGKGTRFKKGTKPLNTWKPIGTETVTKDGYRVRKVTDVGGYNNDDWKFVHVLLWEEHNGPVPEGYFVVFKDRNRAHITLDNLELVTRAENMRRNTIHRYPIELKKTIRALGKLRRTIRRKDEGNQALT